MPAKRDDDDKDGTPVHPLNDPNALLLRLTEALEGLKAQRDAPSPGDPAVNMTEALIAALAPALERLADAQISGAKLQAMETRRAHRPSNETPHLRSVFNRRGQLLENYQKPKLICRVLFPWELDNDTLTREEVQLVNLLKPGEYRINRIDRSKVLITVQIRYALDQVTPSVILVNHETAFNNDNHSLMPPMTDMLRMILKQCDPETAAMAAAVMSDEEEEALIEAGELTVSV